jgi:tRNA pseudouridine32 synthase/23S rRNA pseudouridine746 synthase
VEGVSDRVAYFHPQPAATELPGRFPSPFAAEPHPLARRAAALLMAELAAGRLSAHAFWAPGGGKMLGVLVVRDRRGAVGFLRGFSGMLAGSWDAPGFVPPVFDGGVRDAVWPAGERELDAMTAELGALRDGPLARATHALARLDAASAAELAALAASQRARRDARRRERDAYADDPERRHALDQQSRADKAERRRLLARRSAERDAPAAALARLEREARALAAARAARSRALTEALWTSYVVPSAGGVARPLRSLFAPAEPPGGSGDCAAPKLVAHALRTGLRPLALAELWWGAPPATGGRLHRHTYPACRGKCGPILPFMLAGLDLEPPPRFDLPVGAAEPRTLFEDAFLAAVDKPVGLLSVPGRDEHDSVLTRLRARYPSATGPIIVHRLDLDTSGVMLIAKTAEVHAALQRLFAMRAIDKRYIALIDGALAGVAGAIDLPLRVDLDDRPRQLVDPVHGKPALTTWRVLAREPGHTRVELRPHTGRSHQLRVHAAHPRGLGAPIIGDRLYGHPGARLMLHAAELAFTHPITGARLELVAPAPF